MINTYDIEKLKNRINLMENELDVLKHWVDLLIKESENIKIIDVDSKSAIKNYDDTVTHGCYDPVVIITD